jgi:hypothetical protein
VGVLLTGLLIPLILARIRAEECLLRTQFGDEYGAYCTRTSRLIPGLYERCARMRSLIRGRIFGVRQIMQNHLCLYEGIPPMLRGRERQTYPLPGRALPGYTVTGTGNLCLKRR